MGAGESSGSAKSSAGRESFTCGCELVIGEDTVDGEESPRARVSFEARWAPGQSQSGSHRLHERIVDNNDIGQVIVNG